MKLLTAFVAALTLFGFGSAAFACDGMMKRNADTAQTDAPLIPPVKKTS